MKKIGIICEYNPFHNGHIYHIKKIKEKFKDCHIVLIMSGNFTQRGERSLLNKWDKTEIALNYVDLVVELPFIYAVQSADMFAYASINILKEFNIDYLVFGTETLDSDSLIKIALTQKTENFNNLVKNYLKEGLNYPTSLSKAVYDLTKIKVEKPNDLLGLSYAKEIINTNIVPICIQRTNNYHDLELKNSITSGSSIRKAIREKKDIKKYVPIYTYEKLNNNISIDDYFNILKYKIISEINNLNIYLNVDEGIENRIKKYIYDSNNLEELIKYIKTKRYTYNKLKRMFVYILCGIKKDDINKDIEYIRILGMNKNGKKILKNIKTNIPLITNYSNKYKDLEIEMKATYIYNIFEKDIIKLTKEEYKHKPIIK